MLDVLYKDRVTVRRPTGCDVRNEITYEEIKADDGGTLALACRIEKNGRRVTNNEGTQIQTDATMIFKVKPEPVVSLQDLVVLAGETYRVVGLTSQNLIGVGAEYVRADLVFDRQPVTEDVDAS